jgi:hypothetical protein
MFVGTTGVDRVVERAVQLMREHDTDDIARHGGIPLEVIQKYLNFHYSVSLDLFGGETSTNVANYCSSGLKGRWQEDRRTDDHVLTSAVTAIEQPGGDRIVTTELPALTTLNHDLRRLHQGLRDRGDQVEPDPGQPRDHRASPAGPAARGVQQEGRRVRRLPRHARRPDHRCRRLGGRERRLAAHPGRQGARGVADVPGLRAGEDRRLAGPAAQRHQRPAPGCAVCADGGDVAGAPTQAMPLR